MASTILSFLHMFGARSASTTIAPNSWATICLWRRYFQWKDETELQQMEAICEVLDVEPNFERREVCPIQSDAARDARLQFLRETNQTSRWYTSSERNSNGSIGSSHGSRLQQHQQQRDSRILDNPDLSVSGMFLAQ